MSRSAATKPVAYRALLGGLIVLAINGCAAPSAPADRTTPARTVVRPAPPPAKAVVRPATERAAIEAVKQVGVPYRYGGETPSGFDCSGLVQYAYAQVGLRMPRTTGSLWRELAPVQGSALKVGDVLFFDIAGKVSHVGLYLGDDRFVHAPSSGREVSIASLSSVYYRSTFVRGGRRR